MVREIGENYYRSACFHFEDDINNMGLFRATDQFGFGFLPVYFVSNVEVKIKCGKCRFNEDDDTFIDDYPGPRAVPNGRRYDWDMPSPKENLLVELENLFGFRPGTAITISLVLYSGNRTTLLEYHKWMAQDVVPLTFPVLQRLRDTNCRARLLLNANHRDDSASFASQWDPTSLETITADFWEVCTKFRRYNVIHKLIRIAC
jgi:hypothetical protein